MYGEFIVVGGFNVGRFKEVIRFILNAVQQQDNMASGSLKMATPSDVRTVISAEGVAQDMTLFMLIGGYRLALEIKPGYTVPDDVIIATDAGAAALWIGGSLAANAAYNQGDRDGALRLLARLFYAKMFFKVNASSELANAVADRVTWLAWTLVVPRLGFSRSNVYWYTDLATKIAPRLARMNDPDRVMELLEPVVDRLDKAILAKALIRVAGSRLWEKEEKPSDLIGIAIRDIGRLSGRGRVSSCTLRMLKEPLSKIDCPNGPGEDIFLTNRAAKKMRSIMVTLPDKASEKLLKVYGVY